MLYSCTHTATVGFKGVESDTKCGWESFFSECHTGHAVLVGVFGRQVLCTPKRARMIVVVVCVAAACATSPEFFECSVQPITNPSTNATRLACLPTALSRLPGYSLGYKYANQALFTFIPLVLLAVFNSLLINAVLKAARQRQMMAKTGSQCMNTRSTAAPATADVSSGHERQRRGQQRITVSHRHHYNILYYPYSFVHFWNESALAERTVNIYVVHRVDLIKPVSMSVRPQKVFLI